MNSQTFSAIFLALIFTALLGFVSWLKWEPSYQAGDVLSGEVILHKSGATGKTASQPYFVVLLKDGTQIKVKDYGQLPPTYKGLVELDKRLGKTSGRVTYEFKL